MTLVEQFHSAHKARLSRLGAIPPRSPNLSGRQQEEQRQSLLDLQAKCERQQDIISNLNAIIAKQRLVIRKFADQTEITTPRIADVVAVIAEHYGLTKAIVVGTQRTEGIAFPRQVGYFICRELGYAWHAIGRGFGKDHSSALHGNQKISQKLQGNPALALEIEDIKTKIDNYVARRVETAKAALE